MDTRALAAGEAHRYVRMRSAEDGQPAMWVFGGVKLVKLNGQVARPIVGMGGVTFTQAVERSPGVYDWQLDEVGYYLDLQTGAVIDEMINPFTGKMVRPAHYRAPEYLRFTGTQVVPQNPLPPSIEFEGRITRLADVAGMTAMTEDMYLTIPQRPATQTKPARPARQLTSLKTYTARADQLDSGYRGWVDCQYSYTTMNSLASWLTMDSQAGVQNMRLAGTKCPLLQPGVIPDWFIQRVTPDHPDFLAAPLSRPGTNPA